MTSKQAPIKKDQMQAQAQPQGTTTSSTKPLGVTTAATSQASTNNNNATNTAASIPKAEPVNISSSSVFGKCDLKCAYNFNYPESSLVAKNEGIAISLSYDNGSSAPVNYNSSKYNVAKVLIFAPSLHLFNNQKMDGEVIIEHNPQDGGPQLLVCIPLTKSGDSTSAGNLISQIINNTGTSAPAERETTSIHLSGFTLDKIIPKGAFYAYSGMYSSSMAEFIVYGNTYAIPISSKTFQVLNKIIKPFPLLMTGKKLFINEKGANTSGTFVADDIYISCQPTGTSNHKFDIINKKEKDSISWDFNLETLIYILSILLGCAVFITIFYVISYGFNAISGEEMKAPEFLQKLIPGKKK